MKNDIENAIEILKCEQECVCRQDTNRCNRDQCGCQCCDLIQETEEVLKAYDTALQILKKCCGAVITVNVSEHADQLFEKLMGGFKIHELYSDNYDSNNLHDDSDALLDQPQEVKGDTISRKWLTDAIRNRKTYLSYEDAKDVIDLIDNAPSNEATGFLNDYGSYWHCDNCGLITSKSTSKIYNQAPRFCLRCGCRFTRISMRGERE